MTLDRPSVLFFTISDFGYVNVVLATIYELLRENKVDIHIASFPPVQTRLDSLIRKVKDESPRQPISPLTFHNLTEFPGFGTWAAQGKDKKKADVPHPPGRGGAGRVALLTLKALAIMEPEQYISLYDWSGDLTNKLDPALVVIDPILMPVHDMARTQGRQHATLHPWSIADGLIPQQSWWAYFWKYPAFATGFRYPVPWNKIPENIYCYRNAKKCLAHPKVKALNEARQKRGIKEPLGSFLPYSKDTPQITPSLEEADLPMNTPSNVLNCGPILVASAPIEESDPDLLMWLEQRPTVLVALGTHFEAYAETIKQQALGIRILLDTRPDIQVLWKLKPEATSEKGGQDNLDSILGKEIKNGRVRIEKWLKADPVAILRSGHVVCSVHHGGANSYFEATWAGVPQVVLAMWFDDGPHGKVTVAYLRQGGLNPPAEPTESFEGKTVVITGCASGIGYEAALRIASLGPKKLVLGTRTVAKGEATKRDILAKVTSLESSVIEVIPVDYTSFDSVSHFADSIRRTNQTLDCVLLSAGLALPTRDTTADGWVTTFKVNVLSPALVALELLPRLKSTQGSVLEFVNSISYCNVTSEDVAPLMENPNQSALEYFNDPQRWTQQRAYYEAKLMLMFVLQGLVESLGGRQGKLSGAQSPLFLACCPGQCRTNLYRQFPLGVRWFMTAFNAAIARTAEQGSRTLVTGLMQGEEANGRMWLNDHFDDWSPGITESEWQSLQKRVWGEVLAVLKNHNEHLEL
ncbi:UDP-Glycosyltransferase/glycogen phosphorylase [Xylariaceae sp. FL1019]|nr:UDP-Glycosyltransferase/glycogen phosphorylase [Xylariaceae sp. FL1019]